MQKGSYVDLKVFLFSKTNFRTWYYDRRPESKSILSGMLDGACVDVVVWVKIVTIAEKR